MLSPLPLRRRSRSNAVDGVYRFGAVRALSADMAATSNQVGALSANEMIEGMARQDVADAALATSEALAAEGGQ